MYPTKKTALLIKGFIALLAVSVVPALSQAFHEDWNNSTSDNFYYSTGGTTAEFKHTMGANSSTESGTEVLSLKTDPDDVAGAYKGPNITSNQICHFGTYAARIKVPDASIQPKVGSVVGFFTYYNDEYSTTLPEDENGNGLYDNSEIDFEWLIADPTVIYITAYTDYHDPTGEARKVGRIINLKEGIIYKTEYAEALGGIGTTLTGVENQPESIAALPDYDASASFYTYGFDWHTDKIRWWMINPATSDTIVLWDYKGPQSRITQKKAYLMLNIWHTSGWSVHTIPGTTERPEHQFEVEFDWVSYTPVVQTEAISQLNYSTKSLESRVSNNHLVINHFGKINPKISIYSLNGKLIKVVGINHLLNRDVSISIEDLSTGKFFWILEDGNNSYKGTFVKN